MAYENDAHPIKMGYLMDFTLPDAYPAEFRADLTDTFNLIFEDGLERGVLDRPVEIIYKEVEGLPKGTVKQVIDAYEELVDDGCLLIFGPSITDNCESIKEHIEERYKVPTMSVTGSDKWLGEWTFSLSMGSMSDEPIFWTDLIATQGLDNIGVLMEASKVGVSYLESFQRACKIKGLSIRAVEEIPQTAQDVSPQINALHDAGVECIVHCGFGFGVVLVGLAFANLDWDPPRFMGTSFQNAWLNEIVWNSMVGFTGLDQYDPTNPVGQEFLDFYEKQTGRRPEYCVPVVNRDIGHVLLQAFANARPLSPRGVRDAIEQVKMMPAASGAPGTRISFGPYQHRGWASPGYLVARQLDPDGLTAHTIARFGDV